MPQKGLTREIVVEQAKAFRFAERNGSYDDVYPILNERMTAPVD